MAKKKSGNDHANLWENALPGAQLDSPLIQKIKHSVYRVDHHLAGRSSHLFCSLVWHDPSLLTSGDARTTTLETRTTAVETRTTAVEGAVQQIANTLND